MLAETPASTIVVVDSFGSLYAEQIEMLVKKYRKARRGHRQGSRHPRPQQPATGLRQHHRGDHPRRQPRRRDDGAASAAAPGNCPMELLIGFLRNPKFKIRPILQLLQDHFVALREKLEWGPLVPYNITGQLNQHPRAAIALRGSDDKDNFVDFYDKIVSDL